MRLSSSDTWKVEGDLMVLTKKCINHHEMVWNFKSSIFLRQVYYGSKCNCLHLHTGLLGPTPGVKKGAGTLTGFSKGPCAPEQWVLTFSASSVALELLGKQKTPETETMKPTEFPEETGPPGTCLKPVITDQITSQENGLWWVSISEVLECFHVTENSWIWVFGFASGLGKKKVV